MLKIAICDDDEEQIKLIRTLLDEWTADKPFAVTVNEYSSAERFLFAYPDVSCDLILLDIEMGEINGIGLVKKLRRNGDMLPVIFITGYSDYISEGYDVEALHYLLKPVERRKLFDVLDKYVNRLDFCNDIVLSCENGLIRINIEDITFCEATGKKTEVHIRNSAPLVCLAGINEVKKLLGKDFIFCHRSYLANLRFIKSIAKTELELDDGSKIPLSRRLYKEVNEKFIGYYTMGEER